MAWGVPLKATPSSAAAFTAHRTYSAGVFSCFPPLSRDRKTPRPFFRSWFLIRFFLFEFIITVLPNEFSDRIEQRVIVGACDLKPGFELYCCSPNESPKQKFE